MNRLELLREAYLWSQDATACAAAGDRRSAAAFRWIALRYSIAAAYAAAA